MTLVARTALIAVTRCTIAGHWLVTNGLYIPAGRISTGTVWAWRKGFLLRSLLETLLLRVRTPPRIADQAARLVWLIDICPRAALPLNAVVKRSRMYRSM